MKRLFSIPVLVLIVAYQNAQPAQKSNASGIQGTVLRDDTGEPLPNVQITLALTGTTAGAVAPAAGATPAPIVVFDGAAGNGDIQRVLDELNLTLTGAPNPSTSTVFTDNAGHYEFRNLASGTYAVSAQLDGYFGPEWQGASSSIIREIVMVDPEEVRTIHYRLFKGGTISGRILDNLGMPATNIAVQAFRLVYNNGIPSLQSGGSRNTDDRGDFRIYGIMPGDYVIAAIPRQTNPAQGGGRGGVSIAPLAPPGAVPAANSVPSENIPMRTYFPDTSNIGGAVRIQLHSAEEIPRIDIRIQTGAAAKISGQVTSSIPAEEMVSPAQQTARIAANRTATVTLFPSDKNALQDPSTSSSAAVALGDGARGPFEIPAVPPGSYELFASVTDIKGYGPAQPPGRAVQPVAYGRTSIDVNGSDPAGLSILVHHGVDIHGRITVDGVPVPLAARIGISLQPDDTAMRIAVYQQVSRFQPMIESDGTFMIPSVPEARYRVQVTFNPTTANTLATTTAAPTQIVSPDGSVTLRAPEVNPAPPLPSGPLFSPNAYVSEIRQGGNSILDSGLNVGAQDVAPVEIQIKTDGGTVQGVIRRASSAPAAGAIAVLVPVQHADNSTLYRNARANFDGEFSISGIAPGQYRILAFASLPQSAVQNPEFFERYLEKGISLAVSPNASLTVQPELISTGP